MKHDSFKTYLHWGLTAFGVVALSILFFFSLFKVGALVHFFQTLLGILMPFVYGLAMAYLLTPVFNWLHARFAPALQKHVKNPRRAARAAKFLSTTLSVLLALLLRKRRTSSTSSSPPLATRRSRSSRPSALSPTWAWLRPRLSSTALRRLSWRRPRRKTPRRPSPSSKKPAPPSSSSDSRGFKPQSPSCNGNPVCRKAAGFSAYGA